MRPLSAADVVNVWERSLGLSPLRQALELLAYAAPERSVEEWSNVSLGHFNRMLFQLRALMFGQKMPGVVSCPKCGEKLEFVFECNSVEDAAPLLAAGPIRITVKAGEALEVRLPTPADLIESRSADDLFRRCASRPVEPNAKLIASASATVAEADPLSETTLDMVCAACGHAWQAFLDIASYLWREVSHEALRLMREVHMLAASYGWPEREILALSPARRRAYLELASA